MDEQEDFFDITKLLSRSWASLMLQDKLSLSATALMIGFILDEQINGKEVSRYLLPHLKRTLTKIEERVDGKPPKTPVCSFCAKSDLPMVAGHAGFICAACAEVALGELNSGDQL